MGKERLIAELRNAEEAKRVEESVKTGYLETLIDNLTNWIGVEDDLADSYEGLASKAQTPAARAAYKRLCDESRKNIEQLTGLQSWFEGLDNARVQRLKLLASLGS
jgi:hypothetical protein